MPDHPLLDLTVLVTGATGGIGQAIVRALAGAGARPVLHFGQEAAGATALLKEPVLVATSASGVSAR